MKHRISIETTSDSEIEYTIESPEVDYHVIREFVRLISGNVSFLHPEEVITIKVTKLS